MLYGERKRPDGIDRANEAADRAIAAFVARIDLGRTSIFLFRVPGCVRVRGGEPLSALLDGDDRDQTADERDEPAAGVDSNELHARQLPGGIREKPGLALDHQ